MRQLDMGDLQLDPLADNVRPVFAPVELERLAGPKHQGHECAASRRLLCTVPIRPPSPSKSRHPPVGPIVTELHQIGMHLLHGATFLARLPRLRQQPG